MSEYYNLDYTGAEVAADLAKVGDSDSLVEDAAADGTAYARSNGTWAESGIDQLGAVLDAIKGDETGDDLGGKLSDIAESKLLIKKALTDADVADVGDVLRTYAEKIKTLTGESWWKISCKDETAASFVFHSVSAVSTTLSYIRVTGNPYYLFHAYSANSNAGTPLVITQADHIECVDTTTVYEMFSDCGSLTEVSDISAPLATNANYMFQSCTSLTEVSGLDLPEVTEACDMFVYCSALTTISLSLPKVESAYSLFMYCDKLTTFNLDFPKANDISYLFCGCSALTEVNGSSVNFPSAADVSYLFEDCLALTTISNLSLPSASNVSNMFHGCTALTTISNLSLPSASNVSNMFHGCTALTTISNLSLPSVADVGDMFTNFDGSATINGLNLSGMTDADSLFQGHDFKEINNVDLSKATNLYELFDSDSSLLKVSDIITPLATDATYLFYYCTSLVKADNLDLPEVTSAGSMFSSCIELRYLLIKSIGKSSMTSWDFSEAENWGVEVDTIPLSAGARQSLIDSLITYSHDRATAGMSACTISLSSTTSALLTEAEIAQITAKGFTIS